MKMKTMDDTWGYFESIPDESLVLLAQLDWEGLETFCMLLTLDKQVQAEAEQKKKSQIPCQGFGFLLFQSYIYGIIKTIKVMKKVGQITNAWRQALESIKNNTVEAAVDALDKCLLIVAMADERGETQLDGKSLDLWKMRIWVKIEDLGVLPEGNDWYEIQEE